MTRESTIQKACEILQLVKQSGLTIAGYFKSIGKSPQYFYRTVSKIRSEYDELKVVYPILVDNFFELHSKITDRDTILNNIEEEISEEEYTEEEILDTDDRVESSILRNEEGKISGYKFKVFRRDNTPVQGVLTRDEMQTIYRLYSYYGASITQREVSRNFPDYSLVDFKRILRAFNITKASGPFAPHMYEEKTEEELKEIHLREKENDFLKKIEKDELRDVQNTAVKLARRNRELEKTIEQLSEGITITVTNPEKIMNSVPYVESEKSMIIYLSDMHIGAKCDSDTLYPNPYTYDEIERRLTRIKEEILQFGHLNELVICLMGDSLDGMDQQTARRDHHMPQCMDNNEQLETFMQLMWNFIGSCQILANKVTIYSVSCGNHGGTWEYTANLALKHLIEKSYSNISFTLFNTFIGHFWFKDHLYLLCHGKDRAYMKRPLPNVLDEKTKVMIHEWLTANDLAGVIANIHFVKGDLHSDNYSSCLAFDYRNVLSLFGASDYSNFNFSRNAYGVSYDLFIGETRTMGTFEEL